MPEPVSDSPECPAAGTRRSTAPRKMTLLQLIAATYFMVAGGPYGLEELVKHTGYFAAVLVLLVTPFLWSVPTALMVSELSTAVPEDGGYYTWVRRAMGPFWGFQEAWLSLGASIFDMAIYPALFVRYLSGLCHRPDLATGYSAWLLGGAVIVTCALANIRGVRTVGGSSLVMVAALLGPFVVLCVGALAFQGRRPQKRRSRRSSTIWPESSSPCGTTWAGTMPRRLPARSNGRSARTR